MKKNELLFKAVSILTFSRITKFKVFCEVKWKAIPIKDKDQSVGTYSIPLDNLSAENVQ